MYSAEFTYIVYFTVCEHLFRNILYSLDFGVEAYTGPTVTDALLASFAILQGVIAIASSAYSCRATVCYPVSIDKHIG